MQVRGLCGSRGEKGADFMAWLAEQRSECVSFPGLAAGHLIAPELAIQQILHKMLHQKHKGNTPPAHPSWDQDRNRQLALQSAVGALLPSNAILRVAMHVQIAN